MKYSKIIAFCFLSVLSFYSHAQENCCECENLEPPFDNVCFPVPDCTVCDLNFCMMMAGLSYRDAGCPGPNCPPTPTCMVAMQVEWVQFNATFDSDNGVKLYWQTAVEINNQGFSVERSTDGYSWKAIAFVSGAGQTTEGQHYNYIDASPPIGACLYRLRQIDFDRSISMSSIVSVHVLDDYGQRLHVYPNPVSGMLHISVPIALKSEDGLRIALFDLSGNSLLSIQSTDSHEYTLNMESYAPGLYIVRISNTRYTRSLAVIRE